jgi:ferrous iron transport protein A
MKLADLMPGSQARIEKIQSDTESGDQFSSRLLELGFIPGSTVTCLHKAPLTSNPKSYLIRGMHVALRNEEANRVTVVDMQNTSNTLEIV